MNEFYNENDYNKINTNETNINETDINNQNFSMEEQGNSLDENMEFSNPSLPLSDADYINSITNSSYYNNSSYKSSSNPHTKKKRFVSFKTAIASIILTCVISVSGALAFSGGFGNISFFGAPKQNNQGQTSVQDNINKSQSFQGTNTTHNTITGEVLTTPEIVDKVGPAVVGIINKTTYSNAYGFYGNLYGNPNQEIEQGSGSGVIISADGYIVTNNHVVENATALLVILNTGEEYTAKVVGKDASTDLAVLKIEAGNLPYAQMGTSSTLRVGEKAVAIGNPLGQEFAGTTTQGIISGLNRSVTVDNRTMNLIQTDAAINPGNSGGALVNEYGALIGINTVKISSDTLEGLGFAIPIDEAKPIIQELMTNGYVTGRPVIGIGGRAVTKEDAKAYNLKVGVYVSSMSPNGPAYMAGIKIGDIIVECEGEPIETVDDINKIKNKKSPGDKLNIKVYRKGSYKDVAVILGEEAPEQ